MLEMMKCVGLVVLLRACKTDFESVQITTLLSFSWVHNLTANKRAMASAVKMEKLSGKRLLNSKCGVVSAKATLCSCFEPSVYMNVLFGRCALYSLNFDCISVGVMSDLFPEKRYSILGGAFSQKGFARGLGARSGKVNCSLDKQVLN